MIRRTIIFLLLLNISCNSEQTRDKQTHAVAAKDSITNKTAEQKDSTKQVTTDSTDTTSSSYFIYLLQNEKPLNNYWTKKLDSLDIIAFPLDSTRRLTLNRHWIINDSILAIVLNYSTGTGSDEYLLTIKNKKDFIGKLHISDNHDSDLSADNPYYYTEYKFAGDRKVKLFKHKVTGSEGDDEHDHVASTETWVIQNDGRILKK